MRRFLLLILFIPFNLQASLQLGIEGGQLYLDFPDQTVDQINPSQVYGPSANLYGIKLVGCHEPGGQGCFGMMVRFLYGATSRTVDGTKYETAPNLTVIGSAHQNRFGDSNLGYLLTLGIAMLDFGIIQVKEGSNITYRSGFQATSLDVELGLTYSFVERLQAELLLELFGGGSRRSYDGGPTALLFSINYKFGLRD